MKKLLKTTCLESHSCLHWLDWLEVKFYKFHSFYGLIKYLKLNTGRSYWAKDLIFIVSEVGFFGVQAWLNSYFDVSSKYINGENLVARGGAIQAALNLQIDDATSDKLLFKLEGANGQLPNLDLFNTVIRMCRTYEFRCGFDKVNFLK